MATKHETVKVDPKALENAEKMWANFTCIAKFVTLAICGFLALLAIAYVKFV